MSTITKVFVVLVSVMAIVHSVLTVTTAARWDNSKKQLESYQQLYQSEFVRRTSAEATLATTLARKDDQIAELSRQLASRQDELRTTSDELSTLRIDLARQTNDRAAAEASRKKLEEILQVQTAELTSFQKQNQTLLSENIDLQTRIQRLSSRVLELTSQNTIAGDEIRNLQEKLYAEQQRTRDGGRAMSGRAASDIEVPAGATPVMRVAAGPIQGEVVQVEGRYVSINVGETSGVSPGMVFMVYRGKDYVGDLTVESVRSQEAGGKMALVAPGQMVQAGDRVAFGLEQ